MASDLSILSISTVQSLPASPSATMTSTAVPKTGTYQSTTLSPTRIDTNAPLISQYPPVPFQPKSGCKNRWTYIGCLDSSIHLLVSMFLMPTVNLTKAGANCESKTHYLFQNWMDVDYECYPSIYPIFEADNIPPEQIQMGRTGSLLSQMATASCYSGWESIPDTFLNSGKTTQAICCLRFVVDTADLERDLWR